MNEAERGDSFTVGDIVDGKQPNRLFCGSGMYPFAVVVSLDPFALVSAEGDMLWTCVKPSEFMVIGKANPDALQRAMTRWSCEKHRFPSRETKENAALRAEVARLTASRDRWVTALKNRTEDVHRLIARNGELTDEVARLKNHAQSMAENNTILRKIASHVPGRVWIEAKEKAGHGTAITAQLADPAVDEAWLQFVEAGPDLQSEVARLTAEVERLTKRLEECYQHDESCGKSNTELLRWIGELKEQLSVTTERLAAAAEFWFGERLRIYLCIDATGRRRWTADVGDRGIDDDMRIMVGQWWDSFDAAYQAAIAQGWLPAGEAKGVQS